MFNETIKPGATLIVYVEDFDFTRIAAGYKTVDVSVVVYSPKSAQPLRPLSMTLDESNAFRFEQKL